MQLPKCDCIPRWRTRHHRHEHIIHVVCCTIEMLKLNKNHDHGINSSMFT